jgi:hypothetical protein
MAREERCPLCSRHVEHGQQVADALVEALLVGAAAGESLTPTVIEDESGE